MVDVDVPGRGRDVRSHGHVRRLAFHRVAMDVLEAQVIIRHGGGIEFGVVRLDLRLDVRVLVRVRLDQHGADHGVRALGQGHLAGVALHGLLRLADGVQLGAALEGGLADGDLGVAVLHLDARQHRAVLQRARRDIDLSGRAVLEHDALNDVAALQHARGDLHAVRAGSGDVQGDAVALVHARVEGQVQIANASRRHILLELCLGSGIVSGILHGVTNGGEGLLLGAVGLAIRIIRVHIHVRGNRSVGVVNLLLLRRAGDVGLCHVEVDLRGIVAEGRRANLGAALVADIDQVIRRTKGLAGIVAVGERAVLRLANAALEHGDAQARTPYALAVDLIGATQDDQLVQAVALVEGIGIDGAHIAADLHGLQVAPVEAPAVKGTHIAADLKGLDGDGVLLRAIDSIGVENVQIPADLNGFQAGAVVEGPAVDFFHVPRDFDLLEASAAVEGPGVYF